MLIYWLVGPVVFIADRLTKWAVTSDLSLGQSVALIPGVLNITYILNPGGAFGLMPNGGVFFTVVTVAVFIAVSVYMLIRRPTGRALVVALGLVAGGTAGNLFDRLTVGEVIDWIDFRVWPVFNIADAALVLGLGLIALQVLLADRDAEQSTRD